MLAQQRIILILVLIVCLGSVSAWAQGGAISGQVFTPNGYPAASVPVRVCSYTSTGIPCTPLSTIYADPGLASPVANPYTTDANGNFSLFVPAGVFLVQITVGSVTYSQLYTSNGGASVSSVGLTMPGVFTVSGSPITSSGTFVVTFNSQAQNLALLSPNGSSGTPGFRSIVTADLPFTYSGNTLVLGTVSGTLTSGLLAADASGNIITASGSTLTSLTVGTLTVTTNLILSYLSPGLCLQTTTGGAVTTASGPCGTVSSVGLTMPGIFSVSGSPITNSGTFGVTLNSQTQNQALLSPNGSSGTPGFRSIVTADLPFTYTGNTTKLATATGSFIAGDLVATDSNGNLVDSGAGNIRILAKVAGSDSCQLASDPNSGWSCQGTLSWGTTLPDTAYNVTCTLVYPQASIWPSGTYQYSRAAQADFYTLVKSAGSFTYLINSDHSGANGAVFPMDCMAYE